MQHDMQGMTQGMNQGLHGDLIGHVFPGVGFLLWAGFWVVSMLRTSGAQNALSASALSNGEFPRAGTVEQWAKLLLPILGMLGEARWMGGPLSDGNVSNYQHFTAFAMVSLSGLTDMLVTRRRLPAGCDQLMLALAFLVPAMVLALHGHHLVVAEAVHTDLAVTLFAVSAFTLVEFVRPAPLIRWLRTLALVVSATWFLQIGWMLYIAHYDLSSADVAVRGHLFFTWHLIAGTVAMLGIFAWRARRSDNPGAADTP